MEGFLAKFFEAYNLGNDGSLFMWYIALMGAWGIVIAIERFYAIWVKANVNAEMFMTEIRKLVIAGDLKKAVALCRSGRDKALPFVVGAILEQAEAKGSYDFRAMQNAADEAMLEMAPKLNKRTGLLQMVSGVSTLLGLIGTIYGLILAFQAAAASGAGGAQALTTGISVAMLTTYAGLLNAIPLSIAQALIQNKTNGIIESIDEHSVKLMNMLTAAK
ncbi:MAG: MotA/TolQ/ExbB proton channel family protein [bacterium]|nr:MotA/TolQ/ExbB proton channel family protein [bacterium]